MRFIKIYGEQNSGTIYLEWLLNKNLDTTLLDSYEFGWKHRIAPSEDELTDKIKQEVLFLCLVKNPYSWLISMHKRPYHHESLRKLSFLDFLNYSYGDYRNPIAMWNAKNASYVKMSDFVKFHEILKYEDILMDPAGFINKMADKYSFPKPAMFKNMSNLITNSHGIKSQQFHKEYYLTEEWRKNLRHDHVKQINEWLDRSLMEKLNYSIL